MTPFLGMMSLQPDTGLAPNAVAVRVRALLACVLLCVAAPGSAQQTGSLAALSDTLEALSERVGPAVVQIFVSGYAIGGGLVPSAEPLVSPQRGSGAGVLLDPAGYIITNAHVVAGATRVQVVLPVTTVVGAERRSILRPRGRLVGAQVVGTDSETDLAVLKVQVNDRLPFLELGDSESLRPGQIVMAFGSPLGLENSVSFGVVSAVARQLRPEDPMIYIQTDASINPGNSGGPLVDVDGRVVGISTFILSQSGGSEGLGFAAPSNIVRRVYEQILQHGRVRRGAIGARVQTVTPELAEGLGLAQDWGVILADVYPAGPAAAAGLRVGDIVLTMDGKLMENARQFEVNLYPRGVGETVRVEVLRGDQRTVYTVSPVERPGDPDRFQQMVRPAEHLVSRLGILGLNLTADVAPMLPGLRTRQGVVVAASTQQAPRFRDGQLLPGDVIRALNGRSIGNLTGVRAALDELGTGHTVVLQVDRGGELRYVSFVLEE